MSGRAPSEAKLARAALIAQLAAARKGGAAPRRAIVGLTDSSDDGGGGGGGGGGSGEPSASSLSDDDDDYEAAAAATSSTPTPLRRLAKPGGAGAPGGAGGTSAGGAAAADLAARLGCLGLEAAAAPPPPPPSSSAELPAELALPSALAARLFPHQRVGVAFLWGAHCARGAAGRGALLADEMGLGKTLQVAAFCAGLLGGGHAARVLVLAPKTLLAAWRAECAVAGLAARTREYAAEQPAAERAAAAAFSARKGGVLLSTYGMAQHATAALAGAAGPGGFFDWVVLDEGHKLKSHNMQLRARVLQIPARRRLVLSGTPVQNNLAELHALVDLTNPGLLGDAKEFREAFAKPIAAGLHRAAAPGEARRGADAAAALRAALAPVVLRREKADVFPEAAAPGGGARPDPASSAPGSALDESPPLDAAAAAAAGATGPAALAPKVDLVVWLRLRPAQLALYRAFLASPSVRAALNRSASPLAAITVLKKVCDHPALLGEAGREGVAAGAAAAARRAGREGCGFGSGGGAADVDADADAAAVAAAAAAEPEAAALLAALRAPGAAADAATSCKTAAALALLARLVAEGHRTLVFSPSTRVLDVLEAAAAAAGWAPARVDGGVASAGERAARVAAFQEPGSPSRVFLLTTQVGGVGLTLTAASRCIILSPSWNPAADDQAAGRAHRLGQTQEVVVYRFVTAGTVEDKVYRTQIFKGGLARAGVGSQGGDAGAEAGGGEPWRYFSATELADLFRLDAGTEAEGATRRLLAEAHGAPATPAPPALAAHLSFLEALPDVAGVSRHDLLYSKPDEAPPSGERGRGHAGGDGAGRRAGAAEAVPRRPRARPGGGGAWAGGGGLADAFARALTLGSQEEPEEGAPGADGARRRASGGSDAAGASPGALEAQLARSERLLANAALLASLPDGGERLRANAAELRRRLSGGAAAEEEEEPAASSPPPPPPPAAAPSATHALKLELLAAAQALAAAEASGAGAPLAAELRARCEALDAHWRAARAGGA